MFPTQRMLSREDDPAAPLFPSDFFANINSNKDEQVCTRIMVDVGGYQTPGAC